MSDKWDQSVFNFSLYEQEVTLSMEELHGLINELITNEKIEEAYALLTEAEAQQPDHPEVASRLFEILMLQERFSEAHPYIKKIYESSAPASIKASALSNCFMVAGHCSQYHTAEEAAAYQIELEPDRPGGYLSLGILYGSLNKIGEQREYYQAALDAARAHPDYADVVNNIEGLINALDATDAGAPKPFN